MSTATSLNTALLPDRDAPYRLGGVFELVVDGCRDELVLAFDHATLVFRADPDTDALDTRYVEADFHPLPEHRPLISTAFARYIGAELVWSWLAVNQQGYCDTALLSFNGVIPNVMAHVIASSIAVYGIGPAAG